MSPEEKTQASEDVKRVLEKVTGQELKAIANTAFKDAIKESLGEHPREDQKKVMKEAIKEAATQWMNEKFILVGKWTVASLTVLAVVAILYFSAWLNGWRLIK